MKEFNTNWTQATTDLLIAIAGYISAVKNGRNAFIKYMDNEDSSVAHPIKIPNPEADKKENWTSSYDTVYPQDRYPNEFLNDTEKDLFENYTALFLTEENRSHYLKTGKLLKWEGMGKCTPVHIDEANRIRKDDYKYKAKCHVWKLVNGVERTVPRKCKVYVVCITNEPQKTLSGAEIRANVIEMLSNVQN